MSAHKLRLYEEVLLLGLKDEKGSVEGRASDTLAYALGGAVLAELLLEGAVRVAAERKKVFVEPARSERLGDPVLEECAQAVRSARRRKQARHWVDKFASLRGLQHRVADELVKRGILEKVEGKLLFVFPTRKYPESDASIERAVVERMRAAIASDDSPVDTRTAILVSLASSAGLLPIKFPKKELRARRKRIAAITSGEAVGAATREAIEAMQLAMAGVLGASAAVGSGASS